MVDDALREVVWTSQRLFVDRPLKSFEISEISRCAKLFELFSWEDHLWSSLFRNTLAVELLLALWSTALWPGGKIGVKFRR